MQNTKGMRKIGLMIPDDVQYGVFCNKVWADDRLSVEAKAIYITLCAHASAIGFTYPSVETICKETGLSKNRYYSHAKQLVDLGYVTVRKTRNTTTGAVYNLYRILDPIYMYNFQADLNNMKNKEFKDKYNFEYDNTPDMEVEDLYRIPLSELP